jgi:hypothetical protein
MRSLLKVVFIAGTLLSLGVAQAQQSQPSVKRHPGQHLHYDITLADGDIGKIAGVSVALRTSTPARPDQPNAGGEFGGQCQKSPDPRAWTCDVVIPDGVRDGDYRLFHVGVGTREFGTDYSEDFHVPIVPIENPNTFTAPSKVTVTEQP